MQTRRSFLQVSGLAGAAALGLRNTAAAKPNIIFILADDLGYGDLGCYGQQKIKTPNIDALAAQGMRFTQHYSGSPVCAPSRCVLMTGKHTGHAYIRGNDEMPERGDVWNDRSLEGQRPLPAGTVTIPGLLRRAGYLTAGIGKWGLGGPGSTGAPNNQGFDFWYGYFCQREAHNYYPDHLWRNGQRETLEGNPAFSPRQPLPAGEDPNDPKSYDAYKGRHYSFDLTLKEALRFVSENRNRPFFLYLPFTIPHLALQVPEDSLEQYARAFPETPYDGKDGYLPHPKPRAAYAAMISRMDRGIGQIDNLLAELGLAQNTLMLFASDNGGARNTGGVDTRFFESAGPFRGAKGTVYEGGIRVPLVARWPGRIQPASESTHVSAFWDVLPTLTEIAGVPAPADIDGISFLPALMGQLQSRHEYLYWEHLGKLQAVRIGDWKAVRLSPGADIELYDLKTDVGEQKNVATGQPEIVEQARRIMRNGRTESALFPLASK